jgi:4-hydroxy-tetrahydrodipicolinate synthase
MEVPIKRPQAVCRPLVRGVFAAMTLPRTAHGTVDLDVFARHLEFVMQAGVRGFVLNGATGEYCLTSLNELSQMLLRARAVTGAGVKLLAAIGGASLVQTRRLLEVAEASGADALLLPMPYFFPYEQQDLIIFSRGVAEHASLPLLLYNLPTFTTPLEPSTTLELLAGSTRFEGIKDSSGSLDTVRLLTELMPGSNRVIGNDGALYAALAEDLCDGVVSGVASVLPEFMLALYSAAAQSPLSESALTLKLGLDAFLGWLGRFPVPWGLKIIAAERGLAPLDLPLPMSPRRAAEAVQFVEWFRANRSMLLADPMPDVL